MEVAFIRDRQPAHARFDGVEFADPAQRLGRHGEPVASATS